ncbi:hypothetical protein [Bartonella rattaustraliani]|uniref:hypothetical protein n=1 Tax=Bartonella rattaustraliani TaxID=481139 RepID=UPI0002F3596E|nr:hypothetical protein [Bartonella rattaustraliani]
MDSKIIQQNDILIEKHTGGKFEGFRFYANKGSTDQKTTQNLIDHESLVLAFSKRAARLCACANGDFSLSSDKIVRWIGQPVAQLVATEDFLKPKIILLADTELTGESRDNVLKRLERFVIFHFETALKPLFDLRNAENLTDLTSNLAVKLADSLGILPRREVAEIVKNLDQESRAVLRRLGVRFGAFHIYLAGMLKPAPVQAITLLWTLQNENQNQAGLDEIFSTLSSGRTSLVVNLEYNRKFYQLAGYRILGQRAVRIDILERLANLIRPTLHWKQGSEPKPDGAYDGKSFFVTPAMMSILGANGTDMEEILKGLGYQSQPMSRTALEQHLLQNKASAHAGAATGDVPEAEWVGSPWQTQKQTPGQTMEDLETIGEEKHTVPLGVETQSDSTDHVPPAEPVGDFAKHKLVEEEDKVVLLWHYNYQLHHQTHKKRDKSGHKWQNKPKKAFKQATAAHDEKNQKAATSHVKHSHKSHPPYTKRSNNKPFQKEKRPNPDSPFAKLAALRDQLTNDKNVHTLSSKEH